MNCVQELRTDEDERVMAERERQIRLEAYRTAKEAICPECCRSVPVRLHFGKWTHKQATTKERCPASPILDLIASE